MIPFEKPERKGESTAGTRKQEGEKNVFHLFQN
jgi:hypothetical protein